MWKEAQGTTVGWESAEPPDRLTTNSVLEGWKIFREALIPRIDSRLVQIYTSKCGYYTYGRITHGRITHGRITHGSVIYTLLADDRTIARLPDEERITIFCPLANMCITAIGIDLP